MSISPTEVLAIIAGRLGIELPWPTTEQQAAVLTGIRVPRVLATALVGAGWACAGVAMQGLYRTPLADPALVGVGAGAALGAAIGSVAALTLGIVAQLSGHLVVAAGAIVAAALTATLVYRVASASGRVVVATMLLAGLALSALLASVTALVILAGGAPELGSVAFWTLGSFAGIVGADVVLTALIVLPGVFLLARLGPGLDALALGEAEAGHLGIEVRRLTATLGFLLAALTGIAVAAAGVIAFVALLVPGVLRPWLGSGHRVLAVGSALLGATFLVIADTLARSLSSPMELSVGVITTLVGAPFFLWLLLRDRGWLAR